MSKPEDEPDTRRVITPETRRDKLMAALAQNPQFKVLPRRGAGFIIGGQSPLAAARKPPSDGGGGSSGKPRQRPS